MHKAKHYVYISKLREIIIRKKIFTLLLVVTALHSFGQDLEEGLLLHYLLDGNLSYSGVNGYDGEAFGMTFGEDRFGNANAAAHFDGVDDYLNFPNLDELKPELPVSFSFWIKYDSPAWQNQVVFNTSMEENHSTSVTFNASADNRYVINFSDGQYFYGASSRRSFVTNDIVDTNGWDHFLIIRSCQAALVVMTGVCPHLRTIFVGPSMISGNMDVK